MNHFCSDGMNPSASMANWIIRRQGDGQSKGEDRAEGRPTTIECRSDRRENSTAGNGHDQHGSGPIASTALHTGQSQNENDWKHHRFEEIEREERTHRQTTATQDEEKHPTNADGRITEENER